MVDSIRTGLKYRWLYLAVLGAASLFRLWFMTTLPLTGDESYHWEWSRHLALGYYDHPGLTGYFIWISTTLLGGSTEFSVRLPALVLLTGVSLLAYALARRIVRESGGSATESERSGCLAGLLFTLTPLYAAMSMYMSTDPALVFFWMLSVYLFWRALESESWLLWIGGGIAYGLALQSKFLSFFLGPALGLFVLLSRNHRRWLSRPQPYAAVVVAVAVFAPFLYWNATNGWVTFMFNFVYRQNHGLDPRHLPEFLGSQAFLALSPGIFVLAILGFWRAFRRWRLERDGSALYLALVSAVPLLYFLWESLQQQVGLHWPLAGWAGILVYLAVESGRDLRWTALWAAGRARGLTLATIITCLVIVVSLHAALHIPVQWIRELKLSWSYGGDPKRINVEKQAERFGWKELGSWVSAVKGEMIAAQAKPDTGNGAGGVFILADQYGMAAMLAFYMPGQPPTHLWHRPRTCGENYRFWDRYEDLGGQDAILVSKSLDRLQPALPLLRRHFQSVGEVETLPIVVDGAAVRSFHLVRCRVFDGQTPVFENTR